MVMYSKKSVLLAKIESTYGTDPTPTGTVDSLLCYDAVVKPVNEVLERNVQWSYFDRYPSIKGESYCDLSFKVDVIGSGSVALAPRIGALLKACGLAETTQSGASVTYTVSTSAIPSATIYLYMDGRLHIISGARGTATFTFEAGKTCIAEFSMKGLYADPSSASLPSTTYESTVKLPPVCKSSTFAYNSKTTLITKTVVLNFGVELAKRSSLNTTTGIAGFDIVGFKPTATIDPECQIETSYTFRTDQLTTTRALTVKASRAGGNIVTFNAPQYIITDIAYGDREGVLIEEISGECSASSGNDSFNIVFS